MEPQQDAYGQAIRDYHRGEDSCEIVERDDGFFATSGGADIYFSEFGDWNDSERAAMEHVNGRVLDVGCGAGRHALYLQDHGHEVVGIDVSPGAIEVARDRGVEDVRQVDVTDVCNLDIAVDTVLMMGNNFGLVGTRETAHDVLEGLAAVTNDEGRMIAQSRNPYETDDPAHTSYHDLNRARGRLPGALRLRVRYRHFATPWFDYLLVSPEEMAELVEPTPWELEETLEGANGTYVAVLETA